MSRKRKIKFGANIKGLGNTTDGWRHPNVIPDSSINIDFYKEQACIAEKGLFSFIFIADGLYISEKSIPHFLNRFEPITLLSAIASVTSNIGLIATISSTFSEPFTIARQLLSIDHISGGRAGWNLVTSPQEGAARNHSQERLPEHHRRYQIAQEHLDIVKGLWDSWEDDAFLYNKEAGEFFDSLKLHKLNYKGQYFQVEGPLNIARSNQGYPVVFQAGASDTGKQFGAENADAIYTNVKTLDEAKVFYKEIKNKAVTVGRNPDDILIFPSIDVIVGDTMEDAERKYQEIVDLVPIDNALNYLSRFFDDYDFSPFNLDDPFPDLGDVGKNAFQSTTNQIKEDALKRQLTLRQVALEHAVPRSPFMGTPTYIADLIEEWYEQEAMDGFVLRPFVHDTFKDFVQTVIPILQKRGIYETSYESDTLRGNLEISIPSNRYSENQYSKSR